MYGYDNNSVLRGKQQVFSTKNRVHFTFLLKLSRTLETELVRTASFKSPQSAHWALNRPNWLCLLFPPIAGTSPGGVLQAQAPPTPPLITRAFYVPSNSFHATGPVRAVGGGIVPHPAESEVQLALHSANRCNRPRRAAVIPMTFCSLPFYRRSPLHPQHIKCSNTQREEAWLIDASTQYLFSPLRIHSPVLRGVSLIHLRMWQSETVDAAPSQTHLMWSHQRNPFWDSKQHAHVYVWLFVCIHICVFVCMYV